MQRKSKQLLFCFANLTFTLSLSDCMVQIQVCTCSQNSRSLTLSSKNERRIIRKQYKMQILVVKKKIGY